MRPAVIAIVLILALPAAAQQRVQIYGGYSLLNVDNQNFTNRENVSGGEAALAIGLGGRVQVEGSGRVYSEHSNPMTIVPGIGSSTTILEAKGTEWIVAIGPRFELRPVFLRTLFGWDHVHVSGQTRTTTMNITRHDSFSGSSDGWTIIPGGGVQQRIAGPLGVRASADYIYARHADVGFHNFALGAGLVVFIGGGEREASSATPTARVPAAAASAPLLGVTGTEIDRGFVVSTVSPPASENDIQRGDLIYRIDGRDVRSARDIETAVAASASGTVRVEYMRRNIPIDKMVAIRP